MGEDNLGKNRKRYIRKWYERGSNEKKGNLVFAHSKQGIYERTPDNLAKFANSQIVRISDPISRFFHNISTSYRKISGSYEEERVYALGVAHNLMEEAVRNHNSEHALKAAQLYEMYDKGDVRSMQRKLRRVYQDDTHADQAIKQEIETFFKRRSKNRNGSLEGSVAVATIFALILISIFFFAGSITGNTIANVAQSSSMGLGIVSILVAATGIALYFSRK